jgi:hypothetical protein
MGHQEEIPGLITSGVRPQKGSWICAARRPSSRHAGRGNIPGDVDRIPNGYRGQLRIDVKNQVFNLKGNGIVWARACFSQRRCGVSPRQQ